MNNLAQLSPVDVSRQSPDCIQQISDLYAAVPDNASHADLKVARRSELDITINSRLGEAFPADRRDQLWGTHEKISASNSVIKGVMPWLGSLFSPNVSSNTTARAIAADYSEVMSSQELSDFLGLSPKELNAVLTQPPRFKNRRC